MPILALVLLFLSASMHALWNFLLKSAKEKYIAMGWQTILSGIFALVIMIFYSGLPPREMWVFAVISMLLESVYFILLCSAYTDHDFSLVYPIARGAAPAMLVVWTVRRPWRAQLIPVMGLGLLLWCVLLIPVAMVCSGVLHRFM